MSQRLSVVLVAVGSLVMVACGDDDGGGDDKVVVDSGTPSDGGMDAAAPKDAGTDAKVNMDANVVDTGTPTPVDASGGSGDATTPVDTGVSFLDAAPADTGTPDTGTPDAGSDAGSDAGVVAVKPTLAGQLVITEIQAAPLGYVDDTLGEWVEVYNPSADTTYDLGTCTFGDKAGDADFTFVANTRIAPKAYLTLSASAFTVPNHGFVSDVVYGTMSGLSATSDGPNIVCSTTVIDKVDYSAVAGFTIPSSNEGHTLQLSATKLDSVQNDTGSSWCFSTATAFKSFTIADGGMLSNYGTPKAANVACP